MFWFLRRLKKSFRYGEKGFTLIELLIVIAVLGALAAVVVPAVGAFLGTANLTAANTEAANVKTAAMSFLADNGVFPETSADLIDYGDDAMDYMNAAPDGTYTFGIIEGDDNNGVTGDGSVNESTINAAEASDAGITKKLEWNAVKQSWER